MNIVLWTYLSEGRKQNVESKWSTNEDGAFHFESRGFHFLGVIDGQQATPTFEPRVEIPRYLERWIQTKRFSNVNEAHAVTWTALSALDYQYSALQSALSQTITASLALLCLAPTNECVIYNAGNVKATLVRNGVTQTLTEEHTVAMELRKQRTITEEEFVNHPKRTILTKFLGSGQNFDVQKVTCIHDDRIVIATDGIYRVLSEDEILETIALTQTPEEARNLLVQAAAERQSWDDRTALIVWVS